MTNIEIGNGVLWVDGSNNVSVPISVDPEDGLPSIKLVAIVNGNDRVSIQLHNEDKFEIDQIKIIEEAKRCRSDPEQLKRLEYEINEQIELFISNVKTLLKFKMVPEEIHSIIDETIISTVDEN